MSVQDRIYAAAILVVLGICCIGAYVAVSGFMNANPQGLSLNLFGSNVTPSPTAGSAVQVPTGQVVAATVASLPTAGSGGSAGSTAVPSATSLSHGTPTPPFLSDLLTPTTTASITPVGVAGCGFQFCPVLKGPPDANAPTGVPCPTNYIWGFVWDSGKRGIPNTTVQFISPSGDIAKTQTKGLPDPAGRFDIPAGGQTWKIWLVDSSRNPLSPTVSIDAGGPYTGGGSCPTRLDFVQQ